MNNKIITIISVLMLVLVLNIGLANAEGVDRPLWLRNSTISPDGQQIAFTYKGDAYLVSSSGGIAQVLVQHSGYIANLHWSPDGSKIALSIKKQGNVDVYTLDLKNKSLIRLTWHPKIEKPLGFSPDSKSVLISTPQYASPSHTQFSILPEFEIQNQLYLVPAAGGKLESLLPISVYQAQISPDGTKVAYAGIVGIEQKYRKHMKSAASSAIMIFDRKTGKNIQISKSKVSDLEPNWNSDGKSLLYLSEESGDFNVWKYDLEKKSTQQITDHDLHPVRHLSVAKDGTMVYSFNGEIYLRKKTAKESQRINIQITGSALDLELTIQDALITDFEISPVAMEAVVNSWGDLFLVDITSGKARDLVRSGHEEHSPIFTVDGKGIIFASEKTGNWGIYKAIPVGEAESFFSAERYKIIPLVVGDFDAFQPLLSPDGLKLAYLRDRNALHVFDLKSKVDTVVVPKQDNYSYSDGDIQFQWSPDSSILAMPNQSTIFNTEIVLFPIEKTKSPIWLTRNDAADYLLGWADDGGSVFFASAILAPLGTDGERSSLDVFQTFLSNDAKFAFEQGPPQPQDNSQESNSSPQSVTIDYQSIEEDNFSFLTRRITRQTVQMVYGSPVLGGKALLHIVFNTKFDGSQSFIGVLTNLTDGSVNEIFEIQPQNKFDIKVTNDGNGIWFLENSAFNFIDLLDSNNNAVIPFRLKFNVPLQEYILASFEQYWTLTKKKIYDPNMNGVDWDLYGKSYKYFIPHIDDPEDMAIMLSEMVGELNVSHTGGSYTNPSEQVDMGTLAVLYNHDYKGSGMQIGEIITGGPLNNSKSDARPNDVIIAIDGTPIPDRGGINRLLIDRSNTSVVVRFFRPDDSTEWVENVVTVGYRQEEALLKERWRKKNRDYVIKESKGRLGYAFLSEMAESEYRRFTAEVIGNFRNAGGLIVDERFNLGGNLHDSLITFLSGEKYLSLVMPKLEQGYEPRSRWYAPSIIIANASSYSDGSVFPQSYKNLKLGTQIGEPVPGTGTAVWWVDSNIIPGLNYGIPQLPFAQLDGTYLENLEVEPDILSINDLESIIEGRDKQLEDAVAAMLETIE